MNLSQSSGIIGSLNTIKEKTKQILLLLPLLLAHYEIVRCAPDTPHGRVAPTWPDTGGPSGSACELGTLDSEPPLPKPGSRLENQSENIANDRADLQPRGEMKLWYMPIAFPLLPLPFIPKWTLIHGTHAWFPGEGPPLESKENYFFSNFPFRRVAFRVDLWDAIVLSKWNENIQKCRKMMFCLLKTSSPQAFPWRVWIAFLKSN